MSAAKKHYTVLVLEDERPLLNAIKTKLKLSGLRVVSRGTVDAALRYLHQAHTVDVIWLDHYLLGKSTGVDLVAHLKQDDTLKHIPIFVVSNTASPDKVQSYLQLGVTRYYTKADYRLDMIIRDIMTYLTRH